MRKRLGKRGAGINKFQNYGFRISKYGDSTSVGSCFFCPRNLRAFTQDEKYLLDKEKEMAEG